MCLNTGHQLISVYCSFILSTDVYLDNPMHTCNKKFTLNSQDDVLRIMVSTALIQNLFAQKTTGQFSYSCGYLGRPEESSEGTCKRQGVLTPYCSSPWCF